MYNIQLNIDGCHVVIIGGGKIAYRKYMSLKNENVTIEVISPQFDKAFKVECDKRLKLIKKCYEYGDIEGADIVFIATNIREVNDLVRQHTSSSQLVNHTGDKSQSDFYNMKTFKYKECDISISSAGKDIGQTKAIYRKLQTFLEEEH